MDILIKIAQLFLCFTILVGIHELGHFLMGALCSSVSSDVLKIT